MIFNMNGGGTALNFRVVGGTSTPSDPKENTIWVNTDIPITGWYFGREETDVIPEDRFVEGVVWITTSTTSNVEFNALKKNGICLCPVLAWQIVNGEWVVKEAKTYQGGAWVEWIIPDVLFRDGNENVGFTGGWEYVPGYKGMSTAGSPIGIKSITTNGYLRCERSDETSEKGFIMFRTKNNIDLTDYNTLTFNNFTAYTANSFCAVGICTDVEYIDNMPAKWKSSNPCNVSNQTITLDISKLSGNYYVAILVGYWGGDSASAYAETNEIILSK